MTYDADVLILGGGCAGLSLATALAQQQSNLRVEILEARTAYHRDRTWCFWNTERHPFQDCVTHRWHSWTVASGGRSVTQTSKRYAYEHIPADRFYSSATASIDRTATQRLCLGTDVTGVSTDPAGFRIESSMGSLRSRFLFDSRPQPQDEANSWHQRFTGWHLRTRTPVFDPDMVELMNFEPVMASGRVLFFYVLPFTRDEALVEATCLDRPGLPPLDLEPELLRWIGDKCQGEAYEVLFTEQGSLPMTGRNNVADPVRNGYSLGTRGGRIKPSSGYAFLRIQRQSRLLAQALVQGAPLPQRSEPRSYGLLDNVFLEALSQHPESAPKYFLRLFQRTPPDVLVRFLSECGSVPESLRTALALPSLPFLRAALANFGRSR